MFCADSCRESRSGSGADLSAADGGAFCATCGEEASSEDVPQPCRSKAAKSDNKTESAKRNQPALMPGVLCDVFMKFSKSLRIKGAAWKISSRRRCLHGGGRRK
ncbi:MAG: hypothetical protein FWF20_06030 [Betaproteobacteria bacterium]|nr:hypothetical protein [Betaproteobacteria bacterium]MCL2886331.1 hypothetical protein [Betaproteobacteria bacterium]